MRLPPNQGASLTRSLHSTGGAVARGDSLTAEGDCYMAAARFLLSLGTRSDARLIHGTVTGQGKVAGIRYGHAWVEINGFVLDPSNRRMVCIQREEYYRVGKVAPGSLRRYSCRETLAMMNQFAHYGPWELP